MILPRFLTCILVFVLLKNSNNTRVHKLYYDLGKPIYYADSTKNPLVPYFDRLVTIVVDVQFTNGYRKDVPTIASGIIFDKNHVLTSYNPFRILITTKYVRRSLMRVVTIGRRKMGGEDTPKYDYIVRSINCVGQVVSASYNPDPKSEEHWFGFEGKLSPVHDLMVMRINKPYYNFISKSPDFESIFTDTWITSGPLLSRLALKGEELGNNFMIGCISCADDEHIWKNSYVKTVQYEEDDNALEDCDAWIPRTWGYLICVKNKERLESLGSGSILVYNETVFGIGSFLLDKLNDSILVFTDVRAYADQIYWTCRRGAGSGGGGGAAATTTTTTTTELTTSTKWEVDSYPDDEYAG